jgi:hypothetical protein
MTDLHDTHLCDGTDNTANCEWLRQQAYVRAHAAVTTVGATAWVADQVASIPSRQTRDRREFRLHDTRPRHHDRWWRDVDLSHFLAEPPPTQQQQQAPPPHAITAHGTAETPDAAEADGRRRRIRSRRVPRACAGGAHPPAAGTTGLD